MVHGAAVFLSWFESPSMQFERGFGQFWAQAVWIPKAGWKIKCERRKNDLADLYHYFLHGQRSMLNTIVSSQGLLFKIKIYFLYNSILYFASIPPKRAQSWQYNTEMNSKSSLSLSGQLKSAAMKALQARPFNPRKTTTRGEEVTWRASGCIY